MAVVKNNLTGGLPAVVQPTGGLPAAVQPGVPALTPEFLQQLQQGAATVGNAAQSGGLSSLFAPGTLSPLDPLYNYAKTAPIYDLAGNASTERYKFQPLPDTKYRLVVNKDVIGEASTPAEAARLAELYNQYSSSGGNNIYVAFEKETPTADAQGNPTTTYIPFFENQNEKNRDALFQSMMMAAGAIMGGAALGPALGGTAATATAPATAGVLGSGTLAGIAGTGLGTAAGTFAGGIGSGVPLDEALKRAAISGVTAGVLKGVMPGGTGVGNAADKAAAAGKVGALTPVPGAGGMTLIPTNALTNLKSSLIPANAFSGLAPSATAPIVVTAAKNAATSGLSNLASNAISAGVGAGTGALSTAAAPQVNQPQPGEAPEIVVTNRLPPNVDLTGGLSTIPASTLLNLSAPPPSAPPQTETQIDETPADDEIVVTNRPPPNVDLTGGLSTIPASTLLNLNTPTNVSLDDAQIDIEGKRIRPNRVSDALPAAAGAVIPNQPPPTVPADDPLIDVKTKRDKDLDISSPFSVAASAVPDLTKPGTDTKGDNTGDKKKDTLDKIADIATIAGIVIPAIDAITGGGKGGGGTGTYTSGSDALNKVFTDKLPTPGQDGAFAVGGLGPPTGPNPMAVRPTADWYRYATGPAMDMPRGVDLNKATSPYAGFGPGTLGEKTFERVTTGMARGGPMGYSRGSSRKSFAVEGPGDGRSDDIPAVLSDGEYVIDAETVALLGDGSSRAGAKKLDELRVKIRKHKGRNLAKGKFSVNAKPLEAYMRGGRI